MSLEKKQKQLRDAEKDTVVHDGRILYEELKQISQSETKLVWEIITNML